MPYGSPTSQPELAVYNVMAEHNTHSAYNVVVRIETGAVPASESAQDAVFQDLVDLLDGSADFTIVSPGASKVYPTTQAITPS